MTVLMRALNLSGSFITWTSSVADYEGTYAPESIQSNSAIIVADTGGTTPTPIQKLGLEYSPAGLWLFDGNLNDSSGNGLNLTGSPSYTTVERDKQIGAIFGTTPWTRPSRDAALSIMGALTIEAVVTLAFSSSTTMTICSIGNTGETEADNSAYYAMIGSSMLGPSNQKMTLLWESDAGVNRSVTSATEVVPVGIPCHLVWTRSADAMAVVNMYVNGVNVHNGSAVAATGGTAATCLLRVGSTSAISDLLGRGSVLTSLKIIAAELTPAQVVAEYNRVLGGRGIVYPRL